MSATITFCSTSTLFPLPSAKFQVIVYVPCSVYSNRSNVVPIIVPVSHSSTVVGISITVTEHSSVRVSNVGSNGGVMSVSPPSVIIQL